MKKYILFIAKNYSFEILRPIQTEIIKRGGECIWFADSSSVDLTRFLESEIYITDPGIIREYKAYAVISPGNDMPCFLNGIKVQVFHGLEWKKQGHFKIRDFFDLYCTQGPITTEKFLELAMTHRTFEVRETGWSKLDGLFNTVPLAVNTDKPVVLYAPTFSEKLTSAVDLLEEIGELVKRDEYYWLVKFHPLMDSKIVDKYKLLESENFRVVEGHFILPLLVRSDVMVSDTSSVIGEFMLLNKPVIALNNSMPEDSMVNITDPAELSGALKRVLNDGEDLHDAIKEANAALHPYRDGMSSARILDSIDDYVIGGGAKRKRPLNLFRNLKVLKHYNYWRFW